MSNTGANGPRDLVLDINPTGDAGGSGDVPGSGGVRYERTHEPHSGQSNLGAGTQGTESSESGATKLDIRRLFRFNSVGEKAREWWDMVLKKQPSEYGSEAYDMELPRSYAVLITRLLVMTMLAVFVAGTTLATWYFTQLASASTVSSLGSSLRHDLLNRTGDRMAELFTRQRESVVSTARLLYSDVQTGRLDEPEIFTETTNVLRIQFTSLSWMASILVNDDTGTLTAYARVRINAAGALATYGIIKNATQVGIRGNITVWPVSVTNGKPIAAAIESRDYVDPRLRDFYINAKQQALAGEPGVSWQLLVNTQQYPVMYCAEAIMNNTNHRPLAVVSVAQDLSTLADYLSVLDLKGGQLFFVTDQGYMIVGTGATTPGIANPTPGGATSPLRVNESDPLTVSAWNYLTSENGAADLFSIPHSASDVRILGQRSYIDSLPVQIFGLKTVGVIVLPRRSIMGDVDHHNRVTVISLSVLACGIFVLGCLMTVVLTSRVSSEIKLKAQLIRNLERRRKAEAESTAKSNFLANMSHELRTPMACILGLLDILLGDELSVEQRANVQQIQQCAKALLSLLNNILDIGKIEAGKLELESVDFDLAAELESTVDMFSVQCISKGVEVALDLSDELPQQVAGDSARIRQVFANLLSNASKFSSPGGHIIVRLRPFSSDDALEQHLHRPEEPKPGLNNRRRQDVRAVLEGELRLLFEVQDDGCGIPPEKREKVFESFVQADPSTTRLHGGTGLGLSIVRSLVEMMGGMVRVVDTPNGQGTLIRGTIVVGCAHELPKTLRALAETRMPSGVISSAQVVLAMEGDAGRGIATAWLRSWGLRVFEVVRWHEALDLARQVIDKSSTMRAPNGTSSAYPDCATQPLLTAQSDNSKKPLVLLVLDAALFITSEHPETEPDRRSEDWEKVRPNLPRILQPLRQLRSRSLIAWLLASDVPSSVRHVLRDEGYTLISSKPFYPTRILDLLGNVGTAITSSPNRFTEEEQPSASLPSEGLANNFQKGTPEGNPEQAPKRRRSAGDVKKGKGPRKTPLGGLRVLVAEDTAMLQRLAVMMLMKLGAANVVAVENGQQAIDHVIASVKEEGPKFDFLLMDCQMPICDGYVATRKIRDWEAQAASEGQEVRHMPIVALTAHAMASDEKKCLECGMDAYLSKPIDTELLVRTILPLVGRKES